MSGRRKKQILAFFLIFYICHPLVLYSTEKDLLKKADLWLDMREYDQAIAAYSKILFQSPPWRLRDIRKKMGYAYFKLGKFDSALDLLQKELLIFPDNQDAYALWVFILAKLNRLDEAQNFLEKLKPITVKPEEKNPNTGLGDFILGMHFKRKGDFKIARGFFLRAYQRKFNPIKCLVQLAYIEMTPSQRKSKQVLERILTQIKKEDIELIERYGSSYHKHDTYETSFIKGLITYYQIKKRAGMRWFRLIHTSSEWFKKALKANPDSKDALFNLACISYNINDFKTAARYFEMFLEKDPLNKEVAFYLDCCRKKINASVQEDSPRQPRPKFLDLSKDFIDNPKIPGYKYQLKNDILYVLKEIHALALDSVRDGNLDVATKKYHNALELDEESPVFNFNLGIVYLMKSDIDNAEKYTLRALRRKYFYSVSASQEIKRKFRVLKNAPRHPHSIPLSRWTFEVALQKGNYFLEAYDHLGTIYFEKRDYQKAILAYKKVLEINGRDAVGHYNLGCTYQVLEDWENAEKEWKKAIKCEKEAKMKKESTKISNDQLSVSLVVYKRPIAFRSHKALGKLYLNQNLSDKALKEFKKAIGLEPSDPEPYYEIGKIYHAKSVQNEIYVRQAIYYYEKYMRLGKEKEAEVKELLKSLKRL